MDYWGSFQILCENRVKKFIELRGKFGEGGFGSVYLAQDTQTPESRGCSENPKLSKQQKLEHDNQRDRGPRESEASQYCAAVRLFPIAQKEELIVVIQYLKGGKLRQFSDQKAYKLFIQLINAIDYCHTSKIINWDLKF